MASNQSYTDPQLIEMIRGGNKDALVFLFEEAFPVVNDFVDSEGGTRKLADKFLKEALVKLWWGVKNNEHHYNGILTEYLFKTVKELWLRQELEKHISRNTNEKITASRFLRAVATVTLILLLTAGVSAWWYIRYTEKNPQEKNLLSVQPADSTHTGPENDSGSSHDKNTSRSYGQKEITHAVQAPDSLMFESTDSLQDTLVMADLSVSEGTLVAESSDGVAPTEEGSVSDDIVVRKDQLLVSRIIKIIDKDAPDKESESLAKQAIEKMNPEAKLPDPESPQKSYQVEFWRSPINYKGYKMSKTSIVLFGITEPSLVILYRLEKEIYMEYAGELYRFEPTYDFMPFLKIKDPVIISRLVP